MATKLAKRLVSTKAADVTALLARIPAGKKPTRARATAVLAALELTRGEKADDALKRRGLKTR